MKTLVIQHVESEGAGTLGDFLKAIQAKVQTSRLYAGDRLPPRVAAFDAVITLGGPMNVYQEDLYPFLREETAFLRQAMEAGVLTLGICLGAQMLAKAGGAAVKPAPVRELGFREVTLTGQGQLDPLFSDLPEKLPVLQWHQDMFELPKGATLLATSRECPHQAFRWGSAYGLQFHLEVTAAMLEEWFKHSPERQEVMRRFSELQPAFGHWAERMFDNFMALAGYPGSLDQPGRAAGAA